MPRQQQRRKRFTETIDYLSMCRRVIRGAGPRVGSADMEELVALVKLHQAVDQAIAVAVPGVRESGGYSWAAIGDALGITRQAAQQRYGRRKVED
jgi:hypothetical protein